jgi:UDP-N-acetyl-D-mannosaminuronic acid dehydrogenase
MLWPGAGVGGHCLTKDTYHLERGVQQLGKELLDYPAGERSLFVLARTINDFMPRHMVRLTLEGLARAGIPVKWAKIALLGWAFLANSDDTRNTPSEPYRDDLLAYGATVAVHDPFVAHAPGVALTPSLEDTIRGADAVIVFAGHHQYRSLEALRVKALTGKKHPVIVDGRNIIDPDAWIGVGFIYKGIGRGDKNSHPVRPER